MTEPYGTLRLIETGGGPGGADILTARSGASNCQQHCSWLSTVGYFEGGYEAVSKAYYSKCYETISSTPLNGIRIAFPSQIGSTGIDPALPQNFPIVNGTVACYGI